MAAPLQKLIVSDLDMVPTNCSFMLLDALFPSVSTVSSGVSTDALVSSVHVHSGLIKKIPDVKAARDDDAVIHVQFWNDRVQSEDDSNKVALLDFLRQHALVWW